MKAISNTLLIDKKILDNNEKSFKDSFRNLNKNNLMQQKKTKKFLSKPLDLISILKV